MRTSSQPRHGLGRKGQGRRGGLAQRLLLWAAFTVTALSLIPISLRATVAPDSTTQGLRHPTPPVPAPSPTATALPDRRIWPPGTTAETYRFTTVTKTVTDVQSLLQGGAYTQRDFDVMDQLGIRDLIDVLKLLDREYGTVDALRRTSAGCELSTRVGGGGSGQGPRRLRPAKGDPGPGTR